MTVGPKGLRLTEKRLRLLENASSHKMGIVERPYLVGFDRVSWDKDAQYLVDQGLLIPYVHGGYEITPAGREAYKEKAN